MGQSQENRVARRSPPLDAGRLGVTRPWSADLLCTSTPYMMPNVEVTGWAVREVYYLYNGAEEALEGPRVPSRPCIRNVYYGNCGTSYSLILPIK
jgi:hypothetical protein